MKVWLALIAIGALSLAVAACGGGEKESSQTITLGSLSVNDHGTKDISGSTSAELEVDDFYFDPTFIKGKPGQKISLEISNESKTLHNFSVRSLGIDQDIQPKGKTEVTLTLPGSGVLLFICKYHTAQGMNGEALVGDATPQPVAAAPPTIGLAQSASLGESR